MRSLRILLILFAVLFLISTPLQTLAQAKGPDPVGLRPDAPDYAKHGPFWVGTLEIAAKTPSHATTVSLWYPALNPNGVLEKNVYFQPTTFLDAYLGGMRVEVKGHAIENATPQPSGGPYPLVVFSHGNRMFRFDYAYLTEHLASYGFIVMAIDYADSAAAPANVDTDLSMYSRPKDVSWQIDYAEQLTATGGVLAGLINTRHIAVVGHSYGAYTAEVAAGAQLDLSSSTSWCVKYPDATWPPEMGDPRTQSVICAGLIKKITAETGMKAAPTGLWPSWADPRISAIVPLSPEASEFGADSFKNVTVPALMMSGTKDRFELSTLPLYYPYIYDNVGSKTKSLVQFENADHMLFPRVCSDALWLVNLGLFWTCSDPVWDVDRGHDLVNHFTTAFLLDVLKGDKDAHKVLLSDAVKFAGIAYKTTMK